MSDTSDGFLEFEDEPTLDNRTTAESFHERLMRARESTDHENDPPLRFHDLHTLDDTEELKQQLKLLQVQVNRAENRAIKMQRKLDTRRQRRVVEASLTNMSPEARAEFVKQQELENIKTPDLEVIFEYLLLLGSTPADDSNDLSTTDFLKPHAGIRKKAIESSMVKRQEKYSKIQLIEANNVLETNDDGDGDIRHCEIKGKSYDEEFTIKFDVLEPAMIMSNLSYQVDITMDVAIGDVLERVKDECNLLGFLRIITDYAMMGHERKQIFERLGRKYDGTKVTVETLSDTRLKFEGGPDCKAYFLLEWKARTVEINTHQLDANVTMYIQPDITLQAVCSPTVEAKDTYALIPRVNKNYLELVQMQGVYQATDTVIDAVLMP